MSLSAAVAPLSDENYFNWTFEITQLLRQKNLFDHIAFLPPKQCAIVGNCLTLRSSLKASDLNKFSDDSNVPPFVFKNDLNQPLDWGYPPNFNVFTNISEVTKWISKDHSVMSYIAGSLSVKYRPLVNKASCAIHLWQLIKEEFSAISVGHQVKLIFDFYNLRMNSGESLVEYMDRLLLLVDKLAAVNFQPKESHICIKLLAGLDPSYSSITQSCLMIPLDQLTVSDLKIRFGITQAVSNVQTTTSDALYTNPGNNNFNKKNNNNNNRKRPHCNYCNKPGHIESKCFKKKKDNRRSNNNNNNRNANHVASDDNSSAITFCMDALPYSSSCSTWLLDSGCSQHITNCSELLKNVKSTSVRIYTAEHGEPSICTSSGSITLPCSINDCSTFDVTLTDVLYLPSLRRNLISVKMLTQKGATVEFNKNICLVKHAGKTVMVGKLLDGGLYQILLCRNSPFHPDAIVKSSSVNCNLTVDDWHLRLGHMSPAYIQKLKNGQLLLSQETL